MLKPWQPPKPSQAVFVPILADEDTITRAWLVAGAYEVDSPLVMNRRLRISAAAWIRSQQMRYPSLYLEAK